MLFNSLQFLIFFPIVTVGYFLLPHRFRWMWLLSASCFFYMAFVPAYILILGGTIVIDYIAGILIEGAKDKPRKKLYLTLSLVSNLGILAVFKYANFAVENFNALLSAFGSAASAPVLRIVLPIGLSFHTFQAMAYTIEVYRGKQKAERHFGIYALYVMFYPQLVAGPIERPQNILPQLRKEQKFDYANAANGLKLMAWGFFQKLVVADHLARVANPVFDHARENHGLVLIIGAVAFSLQIFFDFSAYSDIAIGSAQVMGIKLMTNFRRPFYSKSMGEFWNRWHISLSTWFRDYVFMPLSRKHKSRAWWSFSTFVVFVLSGLWHGASWTFVAWGAIHGAYLVIGSQVSRYTPPLFRANDRLWVRMVNVSRVFILVTIASVFFRAERIGDAFHILRNIPVGLAGDISAILNHRAVEVFHGKGFPLRKEFLILFAALAGSQLVHLLQRSGSVREKLARAPVWLRWSAYAALVYVPIMFGSTDPVQFIYFQF